VGLDLPQLREGDVCVVLAPTQLYAPNTGYLHYAAGDEVYVTYVGTDGKVDTEWAYVENRTTPNQGWIEKKWIHVKDELRGRSARLHGLRRQEPMKGENEAKVDTRNYSDSVSRKLTVLLRHKAANLGLTVRAHHFVPLNQVMQRVNCPRDKLMQIVRESRYEDKSRRFEERQINGVLHIRARKGHTFAAPEVPKEDQRAQFGDYLAAPLSSSSHEVHIPEASPDRFIDDLERLCKLKAEGHLTDEEFLIAKQRLLR
jgi:hypothetical protein